MEKKKKHTCVIITIVIWIVMWLLFGGKDVFLLVVGMVLMVPVAHLFDIVIEKSVATRRKIREAQGLPPEEESVVKVIKKSADVLNGTMCPKCGGNNISISIEQIGATTKGRNEVRKKSSITRAGNKIGRKAMTGMTGGLWKLTPERSEYSEVKKSTTKIHSKKYCHCNDCGHTWVI